MTDDQESLSANLPVCSFRYVRRSQNNSHLDLVASSARIAFAKKSAALQAQLVEALNGRADELNIDLQFLMQENVLVLEDTHRLLVALVAQEPGRPAILPGTKKRKS